MKGKGKKKKEKEKEKEKVAAEKHDSALCKHSRSHK